ncbi:5-methylcytosine restriction system specificity protein McrC [Chakrabartyella piscis]|uniref:5-methylcytosine restriction system specificity protein McrC n=1 Tax=Chakrabartyella piscis TaxID=2918914 RepID=UPI0029586DF7|nr:hypothetical protein [Chakrabartyella piscis]
MSDAIYLRGEDYSPIAITDMDVGFLEDIPSYFQFNQKSTPENLGLFYEKNKGELKASRYAGVMPLVGEHMPDGSFITVTPRFGANATNMLLYIMQSDDFYQNHCQGKNVITFASHTTAEWNKMNFQNRNDSVLFGTYRDAKKFTPGTATSNEKDINFGALQGVFEIMEFLPACQHVCQAMLKQQSIRREENLVGKMKGKLNLNKQIKHNIVTGRMDRNYCSYNQMSIDNKENRILKYALYLVGQVKSEYPSLLEEEFAFCQRALASVKLTPCGTSDFNGLKNNGVFQYYTPALESAKKIISRISVTFDKSGNEKSSINKAVTPFFIQMDLLFELFCRAVIGNALKSINNETQSQYHLLPYQEGLKLFGNSPTPDGFANTHIPDLAILDQENQVVAVIDAKYSWLHNDGRNRTFQIMAYMLRLNCKKGGFISPYNPDDKMQLYEKNDMNIGLPEQQNQNIDRHIGFHLPIDVTVQSEIWEMKIKENLLDLLK